MQHLKFTPDFHKGTYLKSIKLLIASVCFTFFAVKTDRTMGQISITAIGTPVTENFNTLIKTGSNIFTNNTTILGWYSAGASSIIIADDGSIPTSYRLFSFGNTGSTERALGAESSGSSSMRYGCQLINNTGSPILSFNISYIGEQWSIDSNGVQTVTFDYKMGGTSFTTGTWTPVTQLDFNAPHKTGTKGAIDGNLPANQTAISFILNLPASMDDGDTIWFRWSKTGSYGPGMGIDSLSITAYDEVSVKNPKAEINKFNIYPNPNNGNFHLEVHLLNRGNITMKIFNLLGEEIFVQQFTSNSLYYKEDVQPGYLQSGIYFVNLQSGDKSMNAFAPFIISNNK